MNENFLGFEFSPLQLSDYSSLSGFLERHPQPLTGYTFSALAAWQPFFRYAWAFAEPEVLLISCIIDPDPNRHLLQPLGSPSAALKGRIVDQVGQLNYALKMIGVSDIFLKENPDLLRSFSAREDRAVSNYVYSTTSLAELPGRKYAKKRNLLAQASNLYVWSVRELTGAFTPLCSAVLNSIEEEEHPRMEGMLQRELTALERTLNHFDEFNQKGVVILVDERPVAFSIYEAISPTTVAIHFERALRSYKGLYQVINWETAKVIATQGFEFINREEDVGDQGLRDAKLSYHPVEIIPAYELVHGKPGTLTDIP
jgi:hypothetical protein